MLEFLGLTGFEGHYPSQLSHGIQQRLAIASALAISFDSDPSLLLRSSIDLALLKNVPEPDALQTIAQIVMPVTK